MHSLASSGNSKQKPATAFAAKSAIPEGTSRPINTATDSNRTLTRLSNELLLFAPRRTDRRIKIEAIFEAEIIARLEKLNADLPSADEFEVTTREQTDNSGHGG